jgi:hypothetical protein
MSCIKPTYRISGTILLLTLICVCLMLIDCGTKGPTTSDNGDPTIEKAWDYYSLQQWDQAISEFTAVANSGYNIAEAYSGIGWSKLHRLEPQSGLNAFQTSLLDDANYLNSLAGEAFSQRDVNNPDNNRLLAKARKCLLLAPDYQFDRETSVNSLDLHILMAQVFFTQQDFDSSYFHCRQVDESVSIARLDTLSWNGANSYESALLSELSRLSQLVSN